MRRLMQLALVLLASTAIRADIVTSLNFGDPAAGSQITVLAGSSVTIDLGLAFNPLPATNGTPEFIDINSASPVAECVTDPNPCVEIQNNTTASSLVNALTNPFVEVVAGTAAGLPNFFAFTSVGTFPLTLNYPKLGVFALTLAGPATDQEQFSELQCETQFTAGVPGSPSCNNIATFPISGAVTGLNAEL